MRIAFITTSLDPGGAETALAALALGLVDSGMRGLVIALRGSGRLVSQLRAGGVAVAALQADSATGIALQLPRVVREIRTFGPDIVQGWMYHGNLVATAATLFCRGRLHWGIRQALGALDREREATNRLIRLGALLSSRPRHVVYNSQRARADHEKLGYSQTRSVVIANGFDTEALRPDAGIRMRLRMELKLAEDEVLIGHLARYHPVKDHETFLQAASELCRRGSRTRFLMAGRGIDGSNAELTAAIDRLGLAGRIAMRGEVDEVATLIPGLDVLCVSSRSEAFPNVLGEAMSCGVPCVTTDVGDAAVIAGDTGLVVPPADPARLARALSEVADLEPATRRLMGVAARTRICEHYSLRSTINQYARLYGAEAHEH
jgi:glycosyltransferase involved in cell wall biosynthesis